MSQKQRIEKLCNKLITDGEDLFQIAKEIKKYDEDYDDIEQLFDELDLIKKSIIDSVSKLKKELL